MPDRSQDYAPMSIFRMLADLFRPAGWQVDYSGIERILTDGTVASQAIMKRRSETGWIYRKMTVEEAKEAQWWHAIR